jgi:uncharacterized protein YjiS (DUF1127 family)
MSENTNVHTRFCPPEIAGPRHRTAGFAFRGSLAVVEWLSECRQRSRGRRALCRLDKRSLRDIGVTFGEAQWEAGKWFWQE